MAGPTVVVSVLADTKNARKNLADLGGNGRRMGNLLKVGAAAGAAGLIALSAAAVKAVGDASSLEQSVGGVASVFGRMADQVGVFSAKAADAVGLSKNSYNELATIIGTTLKNSGTPLNELAGATDNLVSRSADLAATFGGPVTDASNAVASALRGEFEPLRRYGVALSVAEINARAMADTGKTNADQLTKQEKALATQALIMEQSADAAGAFARESDTLAGQQERLRANSENLSAMIGGALLPLFTAGAKVANQFIGSLANSEGFATFLENAGQVAAALVSGEAGLGGWVGQLAQLLPLLSPFGLILQAVLPILPTLTGSLMQLGQALGGALTAILPSVVSLLQAVADALSGALAAILPIIVGLVVQLAEVFAVLMPALAPVVQVIATILSSALSALVPIITVVAEVLGGVLSSVLTAIQPLLLMLADVLLVVLTAAMPIIDAALMLVSAFLPLLPVVAELIGALLPPLVEILMALLGPILQLIQPLMGLLGPALQFVAGILSAIIGVVVKVIQTLLGLITGSKQAQQGVKKVWDGIMAFFAGIPKRIGEFFTNAGMWLVSAGRSLIQGFIDGIKGMIGAVGDAVGGVVEWAQGFFPNSPAKRGPLSGAGWVRLRNSGAAVMQQFADGMHNVAPFDQLGTLIVEPFDRQLSVAGSASMGGWEGRRPLQIDVSGGLSTAAEIGRAIVDAVDEYDRLKGGGK